MPTIKTTGPPQNAGAINTAVYNERKAVPDGVKASAEPIQAYLEAKVATPYPPPSTPGNPAHLRTGKYMRAWNVKAADVTLTITNTAGYAVFLEFGTRKMAARPALSGGKGGGMTSAARTLVRKAGTSAADTAKRRNLLRAPTA